MSLTGNTDIDNASLMAIAGGEADDASAAPTNDSTLTPNSSAFVLQSAGAQSKAVTNSIASDEYNFASVSMFFIIFFIFYIIIVIILSVFVACLTL